MKVSEQFWSSKRGGFNMRFANDYEVSVHFSPIHYCSNQGPLSTAPVNDFTEVSQCRNAELAIINNVEADECKAFVTRIWADECQDSEVYEHCGQAVLGFATPDQVADAITWAAKQKRGKR